MVWMQMSHYVCARGCVLGDVEEVEASEKTEKIEKTTLKIFKNITLLHEAGMVTLEVSKVSMFSNNPAGYTQTP